MGSENQQIYFALNLELLPNALKQKILSKTQAVNLRERSISLSHKQAALLGYARSLVFWHQNFNFCSFCGNKTSLQTFGQAQVCTNPACGKEHYPRIDPAVIVFVHDQDYCLLGRQANWKKNMYSAIAGYVEPGESIEDAAIREVYEETGVEITNIRYYSSQPWPFSGSIMMGFLASSLKKKISLNDRELEDARWFSRTEIKEKIAAQSFKLPPRDTIARNLIESWL